MASKGGGLASARKMAKKGGTATLQVEITSDEEWDILLERKGLIVADVFSEWCGPCVAMMSNLKKVKLEHGSDNLHLAVANADSVDKLSRFKGRSEPTWVFIAGGQLLRVFFGSNAPALMKLIISEIRKEIAVMEGAAERDTVGWDELTEDEKKKEAEMEAKRKVEIDKLTAEVDLAKQRVRRRNLERMARLLTNMTVVIFFPHAITEPDEEGGTKRTCQAAYQLMVKYETAGLQILDQLDRLINEDDLKAIMYNSDFTLPPEIVNEMNNRRCLVSLLQEVSVATPERQLSSSSVSSNDQHGKLDRIEEVLSSFVFGDSKNPENPSDDSVAFIFGKQMESGEKVPACWTPMEHTSKTAALQTIFPHKVTSLDLVLEDLPPPSYVIIFEASRAHEVLEVAEPFSKDVIHLAFFTTDNPETAEKICHTIHDLEKKNPELIAEAKMVIALKKSNSDPMLTLASLAPLYVSPDLRTGTKEMELWFPPTIDLTPEPNPWAPPPLPPPKYYKDDDDNLYIEEEQSGSSGELRRFRKLIQTSDGTEVEDSEWEEVVITEQPPQQSEQTSEPTPNNVNEGPGEVEEVTEQADSSALVANGEEADCQNAGIENDLPPPTEGELEPSS